ncbi:hypothetical protein M6B38_175940 [Iris pallida]|uniref:Uncharacterized protein n=1 Tax=Iris pallida TaxID=29817 RepID=A0AAX6ERA5_IRIPA|nr:hypothetical protein M6B38_175940 [Iris pallida]
MVVGLWRCQGAGGDAYEKSMQFIIKHGAIRVFDSVFRSSSGTGRCRELRSNFDTEICFLPRVVGDWESAGRFGLVELQWHWRKATGRLW